nr:MAG TPA: hypothetical protein [Caudoviricetes sp.]DAU96877.1 MAG TPA: hypothetical protein [Caudoviricetes sp.]
MKKHFSQFVEFLKLRDNQSLILAIIIAISLFKIAFYGITINDEIYISGNIDSNIMNSVDVDILR